MTTPFENFVNIALGKSLSADVTLPTADDIPVFTGIGRQVTGKTKAELGLATSSQLTDKADLVDGLVPANQLPGYVDDVLEYADLASFPLLGEASKLYIAIDTNLVYRWGGSTYVVTSASLALGDTSTTAYRGDRGKTAYDHSQATGNPHNLPAASTGADGYLTSTDWNTFNGKLGLADVRFAFVSDSGTTYTVPESAVTAVGRTIIELSNSSLGSITINAATGTGKSVGDSVNICITGVYNAQVLVGSGATLQGDLTFSYQHHTKTLVYKGSNIWIIVGIYVSAWRIQEKQLKILKLTFTGSIVNEASTASNTLIYQDGTVSLAGNKLNLNGSADCSVRIEQNVGSDWFNLQRDFDLKFDLVITSGTEAGEVLAFIDTTNTSTFKLLYGGLSGFSELRLWSGSPLQTFSLVPGYGVVPKNTVLNCVLEYRKTSAKLYINNVLAIDAPALTQPINITRDFWLGGYGIEDTCLGSLDNVEMTLLIPN
jgi:hypothetical protein